MPDIVTSRTFTDGEKGITATKLNDIIGSSVIQPSFVSSKPVAGSTAAGDNLLLLKSGGTYAQIDSSAFAAAMVPLLPDPKPTIWSVRLRTFNSLGNSTFEVDQRKTGGTNLANGVFMMDRWPFNKGGALTAQMFTGQGSALINVPGTSFCITNAILNTQLTTQQTILAAGDFMQFVQTVEGPQFRELSADVHSISILVQIAGTTLPVKLSVAIRDTPTTKSLVKLVTVTTGGWNLIQLPNLPVFPAGNFSTAAGSPGYLFSICLAAGSSMTAPAADTWQNGNFVGAPGMDNFASKPVNATCQVAFVQHEPGPQCSTPMDKPFTQNYDECLRYYTKSYPYGIAPGANNAAGAVAFALNSPQIQQVSIPVSFPKVMAKSPTVTGYSTTGAINNVRDIQNSADRAISSVLSYNGDRGFSGFLITGGVASPAYYGFHYTADTGL